MSDTISRQDAIDAICFICQGNDRKCSQYPCEEAEALMRIPTIERKKGKWIDCGYPDEAYAEVMKCPFCGEESFGGNFCDNCGADMRGGGDG